MDMTHWLEYFVTGLETQMLEVRIRGEQVIRRDVLVRQHSLNKRQEGALGLALSNGRFEIIDFESACPAVSKRTLQRDLSGLLAAGLIKEVGAGPTDPTRHYVLNEL